ncbi:hypothetical protein V3C99_008809 [Haemonchus contortus]
MRLPPCIQVNSID